jgi:iron(III) transport system ATP-binding protein
VIVVESLRKVFAGSRKGQDVVALDGVSFATEPGEFFTLLGPSGCGKTTTLRCVAGLERPDSGTISLAGEIVTRPGRFVPANKRRLGMVFQSYAVWPHLTVRQNVEYPLRYGQPRPAKGDIATMTSDALERVQLTDWAERDAPLLSGGQQQRVALARALVARPKILLLDEPLSNLDARLRVTMRDELSRLTRETGVTALYVTHDQTEALALSDRIAVMHGGRIEQVGTPIEIYRQPASRFVATFVGESNFLQGRVRGVASDPEFAVIDTPYGLLRSAQGDPHPADATVSVMVRPEAVRLGSRRGTDEEARWNEIRGQVESTTFLGEYTVCRVRLVDGAMLTCRLQTYEQVQVGQQVDLRFAPHWCWVLPSEGAGKSAVDAVPASSPSVALS